MSRGMAARKAGETFHSIQTGETITLSDIVLVPDRSTLQTSQGFFVEVNQPVTSSMKSAIVVVFDGGKKSFVKYVTNVNNEGYGKWSSSDFKKETGFAKTSGASSSENVPVKPSDLIGDETGRSIPNLDLRVTERLLGALNDNLIDQETHRHLGLLFNKETRANNPLLEGAQRNAAAYNKYLSEVLAPISVVSDWLLDNKEALLKVHPNFYNDVAEETKKITYFQSLTTVLVDSQISYFDSDKQKEISFGISSKTSQGGGAAASVASLVSIVNGMDDAMRLGIERRHPSAMQVLKTIAANNQVAGIFELAKLFGIITEYEQNIALALFVNPDISIEELTPTLKKALTLMGDGSNSNPTYRLSYHLLAGMAKWATGYANEKLDLDSCIREILEQTNMFQVYSSMEYVGASDLRYKGFKLVHPPSYTGKIQVNASKNYYMTGIKGKLCFKLSPTS